MIGHVDGGTMRIWPWPPSRVRRPPPRLTRDAARCRAVAPVLQQPRRLLSVTGSTLAWAQRAVSSSSAPGVSLLAAGLVGELVSSAGRARLVAGCQLAPTRARPDRAGHGWVCG
jgi:hypothetical protein